MNLLKQNRQKRATPTNADLSCDSVTPARSRPIGVCLSICLSAGRNSTLLLNASSGDFDIRFIFGGC